MMSKLKVLHMRKLRLGRDLGQQWELHPPSYRYARYFSRQPPKYAPTTWSAAVCDIDPKRRRSILRNTLFDDWKQMADSPLVDAIVTTVPYYLHPEIAIYRLEYGRMCCRTRQRCRHDVRLMNNVLLAIRADLRHNVQTAHQKAGY